MSRPDRLHHRADRAPRGFVSPLVAQKVYSTKRSYRLVEPLIYEGARDSWEVPVGFETDFASIPRVARAIYAPDGPWAPAAVIHDFLYVEAPDVHRTWRKFDGEPTTIADSAGIPLFRPITRGESDRVFYRAMGDLAEMPGVSISRFSRRVIYRAVALFGGWAWSRNRKRDGRVWSGST